MTKARNPKPTSACLCCGIEFEGTRKFCREYCRKTLECKAKGTTKFLTGVVAPLFQKMIRAEYGAVEEGFELAVVRGEFDMVFRLRGQCVCITCGKVDSWDSGIKGIHTGHFLASRRASILLEETNTAPQCAGCNYYRSGAPAEFRMWMERVRGQSEIDRLAKLKTQSVSFSREDLVEMWFEFSERLKTAQEKMKR